MEQMWKIFEDFMKEIYLILLFGRCRAPGKFFTFCNLLSANLISVVSTQQSEIVSCTLSSAVRPLHCGLQTEEQVKPLKKFGFPMMTKLFKIVKVR